MQSDLGSWLGAARRSSPSLRSLLDEADDDGLDVALRLDGFEAQPLRKLTSEFESEYQPDMVWDWRRLGSAGDGKLGGFLRLRDSSPRFWFGGEGKAGLIGALLARPSGSPPTHSMTSSARARSDGGIVRPRALAVLRLITSSNLLGCSIGTSAGLAPLRILST